MEAHFHLLVLPSPPHFTKASPWVMQWSPTFIHPTTPPHVSQRRKVLQAKGRGFGVTVSDKKPRPEQDDSIYRNGNGGNEEDDDDAIPQVVFDRMMRRVVLSVGAPMTSGISLLYVLSFLKEHSIWDVPGWLPFLTILLAFGTSGLGIAYGTLSTSWDPNREGSLLGWEEAGKNWPELWREDENDKR